MFSDGARRMCLGFLAALVCVGALLFGLAGAKRSSAAEQCTPAVMVVRHAEDEANPRGGADILSAVGRKHAALYPELFRKYLAQTHGIGPGGADVSVCPIGKIIAIDPNANSQNHSPGSNPFETILPLAESLKTDAHPNGLPIDVKDPDGVAYSTVYDWAEADHLKTLLENGTSTPTSTVIAWDKQGLNPSASDLRDKSINGKKLGEYHYVPLLKALPSNEAAIVGSGAYYTPQRTDFYVFTLQDRHTGKFGFAKRYKQWFSDNGGKTWYYRTALSPTDNPDDIKVKSAS
jgi:hypothetical protein